VADYKAWEGDWELWGGVPIAMTPSPFGGHQAVLRMARVLGNELERVKCEAEVLVELDWIISDDTVVRPDLVVVCGPPPEEHLRSAPAIVVEIVSQASHHRDHVHKRDLYGEQGVGGYWIVDPDQRSVMTYRRNAAGEWAAELIKDMFTITICEHGVIQVTTASLFK
jgi:Uma2 family endonuclease